MIVCKDNVLHFMNHILLIRRLLEFWTILIVYKEENVLNFINHIMLPKCIDHLPRTLSDIFVPPPVILMASGEFMNACSGYRTEDSSLILLPLVIPAQCCNGPMVVKQQ